MTGRRKVQWREPDVRVFMALKVVDDLACDLHRENDLCHSRPVPLGVGSGDWYRWGEDSGSTESQEGRGLTCSP